MTSAVLSDELIWEICTRLPIDAVFRCRGVCKAWRHFIDGETFVKFYTQNNPHDSRSSTLFIRDSKGGRLYSLSLDALSQSTDGTEIYATPTTQLVKRGVPMLSTLPAATCNGLILLFNYSAEVIWNPLTRDFHKLPLPGLVLLTELFPDLERIRSSGFGYDHTTDDYKVVRVYQLRQSESIVRRTLVYSLKSGIWRKTPKDYTGDISFSGNLGVYLDGRLHFETNAKHGIFVFDLSTEEYMPLSISTPIDQPMGPVGNQYLYALGGCLVFGGYDYVLKRQKVWVMRDHGVEVEEGSSPWMELFEISGLSSGNLKPVAYMENKSMFILQQPFEGGLLCVDIENKSVKMLKVDGLSKIASHQFRPGSIFRLGNSNGSVNSNRKKTPAAQKSLRFNVRQEECPYKIEA